ncbi:MULTISPECIES: S53 family peptidase [Kitasatospora]|uniref:S53 family peptidase n=1 Tax=Kitasatospora TaxID=2063 RepID=UPI000C71537D|nr:S53 family serine peptidase [Kitasatospora sp. GP30]MDH6138212.1 subtilase family serine protease [Kitasatospora sp. GP30]
MSARKPRPAATRHRATRTATLTAVLAATALSAGLTGPTALAATPDRTDLPSAVPGWINAGGRFQVKDVGPAPGTQSMTLRVYLSGNDAGLVQAAREVSTPGSRSYAHYLTPSQFSQHFGAGQEQVDTVRSWLTGFGMSVTDVTPHYLAVTATVDEAQQAFDTSFHSFARAQGFPLKGFAPVSAISVPAALGKDIVTVVGLDTPPGTHPATPTPDPTPGSVPVQGTAGGPRHQATPGAPGTSAASPTGQAAPTGQAPAATPPCSTYWGEKSSPIPAVNGRTSAPDAVCGYTPQQMRDAYGVTNSKYTGKGRTVAVVLDGALPTMEADANRFFAAHGVAGFASGQYSENHGPDFQNSCNGSSELPEEPLDVESVHLTAPDAKVVYVAADCQDNTPDSLQLHFLDAESRIVDQHLADVSTDSYSTQEADYDPAMIAAWDLTFQQGALEGIGFDFDSGDAGDGASGQFAGRGPANVLFPASDPWATAAGGTTLEIGKDDKVVGEYGWGFDHTQINPQGTDYLTPPPGVFQEGSTGGRSATMDQPWYQQGVVPPALATANGTGPAHREVPDVSADADGATGWLIGYTDPGTQTYSEIIGSGTSGSSPLIAGLEADAAQAAGHALGFANPLLYSLRGKPAIHDVLPAPAGQPPLTLEHQPSGTQAGSFDTFLATLDQDSSLHTTPGYDDVTGLGSLTPEFVKSLTKKH